MRQQNAFQNGLLLVLGLGTIVTKLKETPRRDVYVWGDVPMFVLLGVS